MADIIVSGAVKRKYSMQKKYMSRGEWKNVLRKKQITEDITVCGKKGRISLIKILEVTEPFKRELDGDTVILCDEGYWWLQLALEGGRSWYTVMFDDKGRFIQVYCDITDGNQMAEDPCFLDMYLDYVVHRGRIYELDRTELESAFIEKKIGLKEFERALSEGRRVYQLLSQRTSDLEEFFKKEFLRLRPLCERTLIMETGEKMDMVREMTDQEKRVVRYEEEFDRCLGIVEKLREAIECFDGISDDIDDLNRYYSNGEWRKDFEDDENGLISRDIKRGVLSEDGLYDLLSLYDEMKERLG